MCVCPDISRRPVELSDVTGDWVWGDKQVELEDIFQQIPVYHNKMTFATILVSLSEKFSGIRELTCGINSQE